MSNELQVSEVVEKVTDFIGKQEGQFVKLNENCLNRLDFAKECEFAKQQLTTNKYLLDTARMNPDSLHSAISNVAAIGITLNPANQYAYLIPRKVKGELKVCLDISYKGMSKLATDGGVVKLVKSELVYEEDTFKYHGFHIMPEFEANPFGDRGKLIGVYTLAILNDGSPIVETMSIADVYKIRDRSEAYKFAISKGENSWEYKSCVWVEFEGEQVKKTCLKRACKTLPSSPNVAYKEILAHAVDVVNEHEGIEFEKPEQIEKILYTDEEMNEYQRCIDEGDYFNLVSLKNSLDPEAQIKLYNLCTPEPPKGKKGATKNEFMKNLSEAHNRVESTLDLIRESLDDNDDMTFNELWEDCSQWTKDYISNQLTTEQNLIINQISEAA